jgi:hypothetical protein
MRNIIAILLLSSALPLATAQEQTPTALEQQASALAQRFIGELKPQLKQAMASGGPTHAIEVCASAAPKIAESLSEESGWQVKRVSLKSRNASRAQPDTWEQGVLEQFDARQQAGEIPPQISFGEVTGDQYRYMQAQGVGALCLTCHGEKLPESVSSTLQQYYPDDMATGYSLGQIRGAISLSRNLQNSQ